VATRVQRELAKSPGAKVAVLGTAYKADIDDDRESPAHVVIEALRAGGLEVLAHDPHVRSPRVSQDLDEVLEGARCVVLITDHKAYEDVTFERCAVGHVVVDTRGLWRHRNLAGGGSRYIRFGCD
jgi:UDP-N-acetyl-D-mannosaminuronate dehydrogenase